MNLAFISAFQQGAHPAIVGLPQDGGRLAAVRPLTIPEPPPLISSTKQGGSITQVMYTVEKNLHFQRQWSKQFKTFAISTKCFFYYYFFPLQGTPVQLHSPAHGMDHGKMPPTQMGLSWMDQRKVGEWKWLERLNLHFFHNLKNVFLFTDQLFSFPPPGQQVRFLW